MDKFIKQLDYVNEIANEAGILSTQQLSVFLRCANNNGSGLYYSFLKDTDTKEYKRIYSTVRKLMSGSPARKDGLHLLCWGKNIVGLEREVLLTDKGRELFNRIKSLVG